ncbi:probable beta-hexosaminidase fdl isoform X2 [Aphidius gifuensis]|nr:probable beta-hexosaminidase fdl isoform X2 [Aphidius gifuensis]
MIGGLPSGWMRKALLFLVLITGILLIAMYAHTPPLVSLQPFTPRRLKQLQGPIHNELRFDNETNSEIEAKLNDLKNNKRSLQTPWSWVCVSGRCEKRAVKSSKISFATCNAICGGNTRLLWPRPTGDIILEEDSATIHIQQIEFVTINTPNSDVKTLLEQAKSVFIDNIKSLIKIPNGKSQSTIDSFTIYLTATTKKDSKLTLDTDESYKLNVGKNGKKIEAHIIAESYQGVRHGLETLSQTFWWDYTISRQGGLQVLTNIKITDKPMYHYRGLLIDTGRQYFNIEQLKNVIDGMAASKLNTFHWHISDSQSFPYDSKIFPQMARWGAFSKDEIYTPDDIKDIVYYAKIRGIRILIEIDSPAHAGEGWQWGNDYGFGELSLCVNQEPWSSYCGEPNCGQLNPINEYSYRVLESLYKELLDITEVRDIIHIGGDEVNLDCWSQYSSITTAMQTMNITDLHSLWGDFEMKIHQRIIRANRDINPKKVIIWSSPLTKRPWLTTYFDKKIHVIQSWGGSNWPETGDLLDDGYQVILSHVDAWYLDCGFGKWREIGEAACGEYRTWQTVYNHRPWKDYPNAGHLILGGEVALWSEQIGKNSLGPRLWPRASAFAERLWSDLPTNSFVTEENIYTRLSSHMDLLKSRGIKTEAMWPQWCSQNPGKCL